MESNAPTDSSNSSTTPTPPFWDLYCSSRQAIQNAATCNQNEVKDKEDLGRKLAEIVEDGVGELKSSVKRETLEERLELLVQNSCKQQQQRETTASRSLGESGAAALAMKRRREVVSRGREARPESQGYDGTDRENGCLGLMAEAFADELDLLRQDEYFGGSDRDVAVVADMMR